MVHDGRGPYAEFPVDCPVKAIWKFAIPFIYDVLSFEMPRGSQGLTVQVQRGIPTLWALVDPNAPKTTHEFRIVGTGRMFDPSGMRYVGTFQDGNFVWHVYQLEAVA